MRQLTSNRAAVVALGIAALAVGAIAAGDGTAERRWALAGTWSDTCSCKVSCPCLFGSGPTERFCEGSSLLEIEAGHYRGVAIDGLSAVVTYRVGEWARIYVADTATAVQAEAVGAVIPLAVPFLGLGAIETVEVVAVEAERTETTVAYAVPESAVELEVVVGANGEPIRLTNLPVKGLPFPDFHDHTQYTSVRSTHESAAHRFAWQGRNGFVARVDREGEVLGESS